MSVTTQPRYRLKWHYLYYLLAAFDLFTVSLSLSLNYQLMSIYTQSVAVNQDWAQRLQTYSELSQLAVAANAPGNDVFESGNVEAESQRLQQILNQFQGRLQAIKQELKTNVEERQAQSLLQHLHAIEIAMADMEEEAKLVFSYLDQERPVLASQHMAIVDRRFRQVSRDFARLRQTVSHIQQQHFDEQVTAAQTLKKLEITIASLIVLMVLSIVVYGHKLSQKIEANNREKEESIEKLQAAKSELDCRSQVLETTLLELQQTQAQMVQSEKLSSLGQLVAGVAHEINNPINFIQGNLVHACAYTQEILELIQLYQQMEIPPDSEINDRIIAMDLDFLVEDLPRILDSMKVGSDRLTGIVKSLKNFSRVDDAEVKKADIHEGIDSTLMILGNRLKAKPERPAIQVIKEYGTLPKIECYPGQLNQVFMNLLSNAIDALEEYDSGRSLAEIKASPSQIRIQTEVLECDWISIRISDNGMGIDPKVVSQLFDPFFTTKPVGKGTGLGLSISHSIIVKKHQGTLDCQSVLGEGATFAIAIPLRQNQANSGPTI